MATRSFMCSLFTATRLAAVAMLSGCVSKEVPAAHKLASCTNSTLRFQMTIQEFPPYQFLLGMPQTSGGQFTFRGEVVVSQSTGTVARVPISSDAVTPCNWLAGHSGYILTWGRSNQADRLESFLTRGQTYDVEVRFSEEPPSESSFWLSGMRRVGL
jgi:hypothetical protein